jgi:hypothetical protein
MMRNLVEIENIEEMRLREGIDDVELREKIRGLKIGDFVRLTVLTGATSSAGETLSVKITSIRRGAFRGELADRPASARQSKLRLGSPVAFRTAHIHSLPNATLKMEKLPAKKAAPRQCAGGDIFDTRVEEVAILAYDQRGRGGEKIRERLIKRKRRPWLQIMKEPTGRIQEDFQLE